MRNINEIILHCTATPAFRNVTMKELREWHKARGFSDIGYHFVIDIFGQIHKGRSLEKIGAHCKGHNAHSIGIAYVGGIHKNGTPCCTLNCLQFVALEDLLYSLVVQFPTIEKISGHNDYSNKACPCLDVSFYNDALKSYMKGGVENE